MLCLRKFRLKAEGGILKNKILLHELESLGNPCIYYY